mmetsp:Transcript_4473/g.12915  ORF Transcript_4473/g.12915 Transcript_4473/m.12915 type:complete len:775 (+) Transcript_4473:4268-6592(+)
MGHGVGRSLHSGGIAAHHKITRTGTATRLGVEFHLGWTGVDHGRRPDGHDRRLGIETTGVGDTGLEDLFVLLDADVEWHVVRFGPSSEGTQPEHGFLVSLASEILSGRLHQIGMAGVGGVARLEGVHGIGALVLEFLHQLGGGLSPLVQAVVVSDSIEQLNLATNQVISTHVNVADVGMVRIDHTVHARHDFFLAILVDLDVSHNGDRVSHSRHQGNVTLAGGFDPPLGVVTNGEGDRNGHADTVAGTIFGKVVEIGLGLESELVSGNVERIDQDTVEVKGLQQSSFPHESLERGRPSLTNGLQPVQINVRDEHLRETLGFQRASRLFVGWNVQVYDFVTVGIGQARGCHLGCSHQDAIHLQSLEQLCNRFFDLQFVRLECDLRFEGFFVGVIDAGKVLEFPGLDPGVLSLGISRKELLDRNVQKYLVKGDSLVLVALSHLVAVLAVGTDEADQGNDTTVRKQRRQLSGTTDRFGPVPLGESQVAVQSGAQVVSVEAVHVLSVVLDENVFQRRGNGRLSRPGASGHPEGGSLLSERCIPGFLGKMAGTLRLPGLCGGALNNVRRSVGQRFLAKTSHQSIGVLTGSRSGSRSRRGCRGLGRCGLVHGFDNGLGFRTIAAVLLGQSSGSGHGRLGGTQARRGRLDGLRRSGDGGIGWLNPETLHLTPVVAVEVVSIHYDLLVDSRTTQHIHNGQQHANSHAHWHSFLDEFVLIVGCGSTAVWIIAGTGTGPSPLFLNGKRSISVLGHGRQSAILEALWNSTSVRYSNLTSFECCEI